MPDQKDQAAANPFLPKLASFDDFKPNENLFATKLELEDDLQHVQKQVADQRSAVMQEVQQMVHNELREVRRLLDDFRQRLEVLDRQVAQHQKRLDSLESRVAGFQKR